MKKVVALFLTMMMVLSVFGAASAKEPVKEITFWHAYTQESRINAMNTIAERFEAETGIHVNYEVVPWGAQAEKWRTAFAAGTLPAAMTTLTDQAMYMYLAGATKSVDGLVEKLGGKEAFLKGALAANLYKDTYIGLPHYAHCRLLYYRSDVLESLGLTMPERPTAEEILEIATAMTDAEKNQYGFVQCFREGDETAPYWLDIYMKYFGANWFDGENNVIFNSPETVKAVQLMVDLYNQASVPGALNYGDSDQFTLFTSNVDMMAYQTGFLPNNIIGEDASMLAKVNVTAPPAWMLGVIHFVVFDGPDAEIGEQFVEFMYREDNYMELIGAITPGQTPALLKYLEEDSPYWQMPNFTGEYSDVMLKTAELNAEGCAAGTFPGTTQGLTIATASITTSGLVQQMFSEILLEGKDVEQAVADMAEALQLYVDDLVAASVE